MDEQENRYHLPSLGGGLYRGFRDTGYLPFYFQGYGILSILLPGIWDTVFNIFLLSGILKN